MGDQQPVISNYMCYSLYNLPQVVFYIQRT